MRRNVFCLAVLLALFVPGVSHALLIVGNYDTFNALEQSVIADAIDEWAKLLPCKDGLGTVITFVCDNSLDSLGETTDWNWDPVLGYPTSSTVTIDNDAHNWTLGAPAAGMDDALDTLKHEIGHALGFTVIGDAFVEHVRGGEDDGLGGFTNRYYDLNDNGVFDVDDFDLTDDPDDGTHAPAGSGDLMQPTTPRGQRHHPTYGHAEILADAYGYCLIPEPSSLTVFGLLFAVGLVGGQWRRRRSR